MDMSGRIRGDGDEAYEDFADNDFDNGSTIDDDDDVDDTDIVDHDYKRGQYGYDDDEDIGDWLDERSQEAISATRGRSRLCNACKYMFTECQPFGHLDRDPQDFDWESDPAPPQYSPYCRFLHKLETLKDSASRGCAFCKLLLGRIERNTRLYEPADPLRIKIRTYIRDVGVIPQLQYTYDCYNPTDLSIERSTLIYVHLIHETRSFFENHLNHKVLRHTDSLGNRALIATWLRRCSKEHPPCSSEKSSDLTLPTRLLDLGNRGEPSLIRLTETKALGNENRYIALSHCWGGRISFVLKNDNADDLKQGVHVSELPLNFQQAISMALFLGIRYLWIDSLCIIQDSKSDWEQEAGRMKSVYKNAFLVIAATGAEDSNAGLYFDRNVHLLLPVSIDISWVGIPQGTYKVYDGYLWEENIVEAPLNQRAWVLQERLLSRRMVHFGKDQIAWECQASRACESFPDEIPPISLPFEDLFSLRTELLHQGTTLTSNLWPKIAEEFASGGLTQETDKCIAISGIAEEIHAYTGDMYYGGLWRNCFVPQMSWTIHRLSNERHGISPRRSSKYRAPSWSWLSVDSHIEFYDKPWLRRNAKVIFDVLNVEVELTSQNVFGAIQNGHILGCGMLRRGKFKVIEGNARVLILGGRVLEPGEFFMHLASQLQYSMDIDSDEGHVDVWCLPLLLDGSCYIGIILVETGERENEYKRIGCFQLYHDSDDEHLLLRPGYRDHPTRSIVTIV